MISPTKILKYSTYFALAFLLSWYFFYSQTISGLEHILSTMQISQGLLVFVDFFEHHGPLLYYLFAPIYKLVGISGFPLILAILNSIIAVLSAVSILSWTNLKSWKKTLATLAFIIIWTVIIGPNFPPSIYITPLLLLILHLNKKRTSLAAYFIGVVIGLIFLIKFNAAVLIAFSWFISEVIEDWPHNINKNKLKKFLFSFFGFLTPLPPFLIIFINHYTQVYTWLFDYNGRVVIELAKEWPPRIISFFFIILITNLIALLITIKEQRSKKSIFIILSSISLLWLAYPRYGAEHLLPSLLGFIYSIAIIWNYNGYKKTNIMALWIILLLTLLMTALEIKRTSWIFNKFPDSYYASSFSTEDQKFLTDDSGCQSIYIYPSNQLIYLNIPSIRRSFFSYPNFSWTFTEKLQDKILQDLENRQINCYLALAPEFINNFYRSEKIEQKLMAENKRIKELYWNINYPRNDFSIKSILKPTHETSSIRYILLY